MIEDWRKANLFSALILPQRCRFQRQIRVRIHTLWHTAGHLTCLLVLLAGALIVASLSIGYHLGARSHSFTSPPVEPATEPKPEVKPVEVREVQSESEDDYDDEDEEMADGDLAAVKAGFMEPCKMVRTTRILSISTPHTYICRSS